MILVASAVTVSRGGLVALRGINATFPRGSVNVVCGPNGAGKSTLLASLAGLIAPAGGEVTLEGRPLAALSRQERARAIGYLPQQASIAWDVDVATLVGLGRLPWRTSAAEDHAAIAGALAAMDLTDLARRPVNRLSGGERARALLARVLAGGPRWILADEPLAALDLAHQATLLGHFRSLAASGRGVVMVVHDLTAAASIAAQVVVLDQGTVAAAGPPEVALHEQMIRRVWGVPARWLGTPGDRALLPG